MFKIWTKKIVRKISKINLRKFEFSNFLSSRFTSACTGGWRHDPGSWETEYRMRLVLWTPWSPCQKIFKLILSHRFLKFIPNFELANKSKRLLYAIGFRMKFFHFFLGGFWLAEMWQPINLKFNTNCSQWSVGWQEHPNWQSRAIPVHARQDQSQQQHAFRDKWTFSLVRASSMQKRKVSWHSLKECKMKVWKQPSSYVFQKCRRVQLAARLCITELVCVQAVSCVSGFFDGTLPIPRS